MDKNRIVTNSLVANIINGLAGIKYFNKVFIPHLKKDFNEVAMCLGIRHFTKYFLLNTLLFFTLHGQAQSNIFDFDSLAKYSYLLIEVSFHPRNINENPNLSNLKFEGNATSYFIRDSNTLYLCTAYHVFSSCDVYQKRRLDSKSDYLVVRIYDNLNQAKYILIPIPFSMFRTLPCKGFLENADFAKLDVTNYFKGIEVNSIESFIIQKKQSTKSKISNIISYGYPVTKITGFRSSGEYDDFIKPTEYIGKIDTNYYSLIIDKHLVDSMYYLSTPSCYQGSSGAPVFFEKVFRKKKWIEFAGTQSGTDFLNNQSVITKGDLFTRSINHNKF